MPSPAPARYPKMRVLLIISILAFLGCLAVTGTYVVMAYSGTLTAGVLSTLLLKMFASGFVGLVVNLLGWAGRREPDSKKVWILGFLIIGLVIADSILLLLTSSLYV